MPQERKGPVAPESRKSEPAKGPTAYKGPQVSPSVMEDARRQGAPSEKVEVPQQGKESLSVDFIPSDSPSKPDQAVKQGPAGTPAQPFNVQEVRTTSTGAELGGAPPTSRSPIPDPVEAWEPYPEVRFDPSNPQVQAQTYVQPSTGAVAEKLVGAEVAEEDSQMRPAGSPLPNPASNPPSAAPVSEEAPPAAAPTTAEEERK